MIEPLLPPQRPRTGRPMRDHRQVVEGVIYRYRCGLAWRDLPESFGPWQTVWKRHRRFSQDGTWDKIHQALLARADGVGDVEWTVSVDSTINRAHQHATNLPREMPAKAEGEVVQENAPTEAAASVAELLEQVRGGLAESQECWSQRVAGPVRGAGPPRHRPLPRRAVDQDPPARRRARSALGGADRSGPGKRLPGLSRAPRSSERGALRSGSSPNDARGGAGRQGALRL